MKKTVLGLLTSLMLVVANTASAADIVAGEKKAAEVCASCHGKDGNSANAQFPKIGGQHKDYLAHSLREYKSGARKNAVMAGFAAALSKQDIENLALYYSKQKSDLHAPSSPKTRM
jgi:cytochrome c553